ncbi:GAF domain-containing protein [Sphingomonas mollis]|uniref:histidine kinase n=1 Tax=Sphingomonas mollis TaxID=2795726 RepID=A0ABS0XTG4_9SPHN|nr:GAF domain-containing protein [Sphingomonas sp. BT553]MBJ6123317.1 PAS domain S-box protein [Sphingomonas sp. BT553]
MASNDRARIDAIARYGILDTAPEAAFDDVAAMAADILDAPMAMVNFVAGDRQWFKAAVGVGWNDLPLDMSICRQIMLKPGVVVVPDLTLDNRFDGNPLIHAATGLRFYAGAVLETPDGVPVGAVCVLDTVPRPDGISVRQERTLKMLAAYTMTQLELRRTTALAEAEAARAEKRGQRLALLTKGAASLLEADDAATMIHDVYALLEEPFGLDASFFYTCSDQDLRLVASAGLTPGQQRQAHRLEFGKTICGIVAETRTPAHLADIQLSDDPEAAFLRTLGLDAYLGAPLIHDDRLLGTLSFGRRGQAFSEGELGVLRTLIAQIATAIGRLRADDRLRESEARFRNMADHAPVMMWVTGPTGFCTYLNAHWYDFTGQEPGTGEGYGWLDAVHPDDRPAAGQAFATANAAQRQYRVDFRLRRADGVYRWTIDTAAPRFDDDGAYLGYVGSVIDIEERKVAETELEARVAAALAEQARIEETLRQAQKMEAVGQLTGGIAHDFNNMLAVIIGSLDLLNRRVDNQDARIRRYVDAALDGARRAANLTQRLLAFTRNQPLNPEPVDVDALVTGMTDLIRGALGADIVMETVLADGRWHVLADASQLENVVLNLAMNARDAMPEGGRLTIVTRDVVLDDDQVAAFPGLTPGDYVAITVGDTGTGMTAEVIARAFDPFFTTKEVGKGTGLGLSQVYGFARQSGGHVAIDSAPGRGTRVTISLPRQTATDPARSQGDTTAGPAPGNRGEVVLVVEDEPAVRQFSADALTELGYRVLSADGAATALRLLETHPDIALMFTDIVMPEVNGVKLAQEASWRWPGLKILFTTGYARDAIQQDGIALIGKPFTIEELATRVRQTLDG